MSGRFAMFLRVGDTITCPTDGEPETVTGNTFTLEGGYNRVVTTSRHEHTLDAELRVEVDDD